MFSILSMLLLLALIKFIRPVFVSRSDQDSRKKTVEEIKRRAHSGGEWPQVNGWKSAYLCMQLSHTYTLPDFI